MCILYAYNHFQALLESVITCRWWIPCVRNSYISLQILLKLYRCFGHHTKMCVWYGYNSQKIFATIRLKPDNIIKFKLVVQTSNINQVVIATFKGIYL